MSTFKNLTLLFLLTTVAACGGGSDDADAESGAAETPSVADSQMPSSDDTGAAAGSELTQCDTNQESDGACDMTAACATYDPDCGFVPNECPTEVEADGACDLDDPCWGFDPDCE